jgi:hypothetical protein
MALAQGKEDENPAKRFEGNRPSTTLVLDDLSAESVGRLLSYYEAKTVYEAFVWGINPFDQLAWSLGKNWLRMSGKPWLPMGKIKRMSRLCMGPSFRFIWIGCCRLDSL